MTINIKDIQLELTCGACPEQYDAFATIDGERKQVGYLRLRHGSFTVDVPDAWDKNVLTAYPEGDGVFMDEERERYLDMAKMAICMELNMTEKTRDFLLADYDGWRTAVYSGDTLLSFPDWVAQASQNMSTQGEPGLSTEEQESEVRGTEEGAASA